MIRKVFLEIISLMLVLTFFAEKKINIKASDFVTVDCLYNEWTGEHVFTSDMQEFTFLAKAGWNYEGIAWMASTSGNLPVYRLYNIYNGDHYYTVDYFEAKTLIKSGWKNEGIVFYSDNSYSKPVYKLYNPYGKGMHYYTVSLDGYNQLKATGWIGEGISFYAYDSAKDGETNYPDDSGSKDSFEKSHILKSEETGYKSFELPYVRDGKHIYGELFLPDYASENYPLVIIAHGFNSSYMYTSQFAKDFARNGIAAYVFDFIGGSLNSLSDGSMTSMSVLTEKSDLELILSNLKNLSFLQNNNIFLMGESQGGMVAALTAAQFSDDIRGLILYYPAFNIPENARRLYSDSMHIPKSPKAFGLEVGENYFADVINMNIYDEIQSYTGPVCIVHGNNDTTVPVSYSEKAATLYQDAELHIINGAAHGFYNNEVGEAGMYSTNFIMDHVAK